MPVAKNPDIMWLSATLLLTALMFTPYVIRLIIQHTFLRVVADSTSSLVNTAQWAMLAKKAHYNAVENLAVFAPLVILVQMLDAGSAATLLASKVYFFARLVHYFVYTLAIPYVRTAAFLVGFACQIVLAARLFGYL